MFSDGMFSDSYDKAMKLGKKYVSAAQAKGENPYLDVLDEIPGASDSVMEYSLGLVQIPTDQIVGTKTAGRSNAFAGNFMPILNPDSEFARKWSALCQSHVEEGIREPIRAYEYMNKFYVLEGNKRVSVLKYYGAVSVPGTVTRIIPYRTEDKENKIYYEFMDFYNLSEINYIWFSEEGSFVKLQRLVGKRPDEVWSEDDKMSFSATYSAFLSAFKSRGGDKLSILPGDAFLDFIELYNYKELEDMTTAELNEKIAKSWKMFDALADAKGPEIRMDVADEKTTLFQRLIPTSSPVLKIGFVHEVSPEQSGWTYAHDLGRMHLEQTFPDQVDIDVYKVTDFKNGEEAINRAIRDGKKIIFTTSPVLYRASLKVAIENPDVKILNCSLMANGGVIRNYSARMYEAKFLMGAIAGAMTENNRLGYMADYPIYGTVANINAFALGAKMVNPYVKIFVEWSSKKHVDIHEEFRKNDVSYVSGRDIIIPGKSMGSRHFGVYKLDEESPHNLAMPIWHWGKFYERMIRVIMTGKWKSTESVNQKSVNYWWGMSAGVIDVICSNNLPAGTARLVELLKRTICEGEFNPFSGVLYSQNGVIQEAKDTVLTPEKIITMDWLLDSVIGSIPAVDDLTEHARPVVMQQGVKKKME